MRALAGSAAILVVAFLSVAVAAAPAQTVPNLSPPPVSVPSVPVPPLPAAPTDVLRPPLPAANPAPVAPPAAPGQGAGIPSLPGLSSGGGGSSSPPAGGSTGGDGSAADPDGAGDSRRSTSPARERMREERHLRRSVERLSGCLGVIAPFERRVLTLRAGLFGARPHTRLATANRLRTSSRRVAGAERSGVRRLRRARHADRCAADHTVGNAVAAGAIGAASAPAGGEPVVDPETGDASAVLAVSRSSDDAAGDGDTVASDLLTAEADIGSDARAAGALLWALILALAGSAALVLARRRRVAIPPSRPEIPPARSPAPWSSDRDR